MPDNIAWLYKIWPEGTGEGPPVFTGVEEGTNFFIEQRDLFIGSYYGDDGFHLLAANLVIKFHGTADAAVPTVGGGDAQAAFRAQDNGVAGGVYIHRPRNAEVENDAAFQTNKRRGKVVYAEFLRIFGVAGLDIIAVARVGAEVCRFISRHG